MLFNIRAVVLIFLSATLVSLNADREESTSALNVCFSDGCVQGTTEVGNIKPYDAWYGIPYAASPVKELRFKKPVRPRKWTSLKDCTTPKESCLQTDIITGRVVGSEDCLNLNVYRPRGGGRSNALLPVFVVIHFGYFKFGSSEPSLYGPDYLMDTQEVVVVTFNFRLGVFGFLSSGNRHCKGNFGLKDQLMALQWVRHNIEQFGGDRDSVTLIGHDAGAISAHYLMMSRHADGLFNKAILMSGTALSPWALTEDPAYQFRQFAALAGVEDPFAKHRGEIFNELRNMSGKALQEYSDRMLVFHELYPVFRPTIEGHWSSAIIDEDPRKRWKSGRFQQRPFLMVGNSNEHAIFADLYYNRDLRKTFLPNWEYNLNVATGIPVKAMGPLREYYFDGRPTETNFVNILPALRDILLWQPVYETAELYTQYADVQKNPVDLFLFNYTTSFSMASWFNKHLDLEAGPAHMDVELSLYKRSAVEPPFVRDRTDKEATEFVVETLVNYAKRGMKYNGQYERCTAEGMDGRFCDHLVLSRKERNGIDVTYDDTFDMESVRALKAAYKIASRLDD